MSVDLTPETVMPCPECAMRCQVGIRSRGQLVINCPDHGAVIIAVDAHAAHSRPVDQMDPEERLWVIETAVRFFMVRPEEDDFLVVQSMSSPCNYVGLRHNESTVWAEVCSRQWDCRYCGNRPLSEETEIRLSEVGFVGGGPHCNYESHSIGRRPRDLAHMLEQLLITSFNEPIDVAVALYPRRLDTLRFIMAALSDHRRRWPSSATQLIG